jgi:prepilin-type N-terminal cleavage/methylation domain-containing protein
VKKIKIINKAFSLIELSIVILIIGILVVGVTQSSRLAKAMRLQTARSLTLSSPVPSFKNVTLWLESTADESFYSDEAQDQLQISTWKDINPQSSFKSNATQSNSSFKPKYVSDGINGLPAISFDGADDWMTMGVVSGFESNSKFTIFIVFKPTNLGRFVISKQDNAVDGKGWAVITTGNYNGGGATTSNLLSFGLKGHQSANFIEIASLATILNKNIVASFSYNGGLNNSGLNVYVNNNKDLAPLRVGGPLSLLSSPNGDEDLRIGAREGNSFGWFQGLIGEIIIIESFLNDADVGEVNKYLQKKWSIK